MKPDRVILEETDKLQVEQTIPDESQKLIASVSPYKGHTLFEINCTTGTITPAKYKEVNASFQTGAVKKKIIVNPNCLYISCLNKKSAAKKYLNWVIEKTIQNKSNKKEL